MTTMSKLIRTEPCDPKNETAVPYYERAGAFFKLHFGHEPSRNTLYKYMVDGFPVEYGGPYVELPHFKKLKRPYTTIEAMERFLTVVRSIERDVASIHPGRAAQARAAAS